MKRLLSGMICFSCLLMSVLLIHAQDNALRPIPKRKFNHHAEIVSVYDKATDRTSVVMQWYGATEEPKLVGLNLTEPPKIRIRSGFGYPGHVLKSTPASLELDVWTQYEGESQYKKAKEMPELIAIVDGEQISLGKTKLEQSKTMVGIFGPGQTTIETLAAAFTYQGLLRLANAKKVKMKVGQIEFELKENLLEALRDLASRMVP